MTVDALAQCSILVVEDESLIAEELRDRLERMGLSVETVTSGEDAVASAKRLKPDIVLMDIRLRGKMDGVDAAEIIGGNYHIPVVYLTAHSDDATIARAKKTGPFGYLLKPFEERDLRITLEMALFKHKKEQELRASRDLYSTTLSSIGDGVIAADTQTRVTFMNPAAERMTEWSSGEAHGRKVTEIAQIVHPQTREMLSKVITEAASGQGPRTLEEALLITRAGHEIPIGDSISPIQDTSRNIHGLVLVFRDLSDQKRAREALREADQRIQQAQKMEAIGRLAGGIAHDVNNMMTIVRCNCDILLDALAHDASLARRVESVHQAAERSAQLARQMLAFSRKQVLANVPLNLNAVVESMNRMLVPLLVSDVRVELRLTPHVPSVMADTAQMEQVIMNLAVNARDAMPHGGTLTFSTVASKVTGKAGFPDGEYVVLSVRDTGIGMDDHIREHLFEPFFTTKEMGRGTGMGLATVFGIITQFGGHIEVESKVGSGSTFRIFLPACDEQPVQANSAQSSHNTAPSSPSNETLLVVDDETDLREVVAEYLADQGYRVLQASNGDEALLISQNEPGLVHVLLTDAIMPGISGKLLAEKMSETRPGLKVLFMSGFTENCLSDRSMLREDWAFLQKPFHLEDVSTRLSALLHPRR